MATSCVLQIQLNAVFTYCMSGTFGSGINAERSKNIQLTDTFNTRILLIVLLECINLLQFYKLYYLSRPEPTSPTLGYAAVLNITITIGIVYEVDLNSCRW